MSLKVSYQQEVTKGHPAYLLCRSKCHLPNRRTPVIQVVIPHPWNKNRILNTYTD
ncbi:hypothetical protein OS493_036659, partial [Desmophyllum pertusum]